MDKSVPAGVVPSFITKVARAKKHLVDLKTAVDGFAATHPYTVAETVESKRSRKRRRLQFTATPANTDIPVIAADAIHNLRSSLDHLMSAMVANKDRGSVMFPIYFQGAWDAIVPGENQQRIKNRMRWASDVKTLPDGAVAILKTLQPPDDGGQTLQETSALRLVNRLWNRDKHEKLPVTTGGMRQLRISFTDNTGQRRSGSGGADPGVRTPELREIMDLPDDAVNVEIYGVPVVGIQIGDERFIELPDKLTMALEDIEGVIAALMPFVRP